MPPKLPVFRRRANGFAPEPADFASVLPFDDGGADASSPASDVVTLPTSQYRVMYTRGDDLLSPAQYRASFEQTIVRALGGQASIDDYTLGRLFGVSSTAYACTEYDANVTSALPIRVVDPNGEPLTGTPLTWFLANKARLLAWMIRALDIWGRNYLWKQPNHYGYLSGLQWFNPLRVREITGERMQVVGYELRDEYGYTLNKGLPVPARDLVYFESFDTDPTGGGLSKFEIAARRIGVEQGTVTHAASFFTNSARIDGMLTFEESLDDDARDDARRQWKQQFQGARNSFRTAVLPFGAKWTPVSVAPKDLMMSELDETTTRGIVAIWGMHPALVGLGDAADPLSANSTYSALEVSFIRNVALPRLKNVILPALNEQWAQVDFDHTGYTLAVDEAAIPQLAEAQLAKSETAITLTSSGHLDLNEGRQLVGFPARPDGEYLIRDPKLPGVALTNSAITLAEYRQMVMGQGGDDPNFRVVIVAGQILPADRLLEIANANADRLKAPPLPLPPAPPDGGLNALPVEETPPALPEVRAGAEVCIALDLGGDPDLIALQRQVQSYCARRGIDADWNTPDSFHVTLLYLPAVEDAQLPALLQAVESLPLPALSLRVGSLKAFDAVGQWALHFRIRQPAALMAYQQSLYDAVAALGLQTSSYSAPGAFIPHITMGYCATKPGSVTYKTNLTVQPRGIVVWQDEDEIYRSGDDGEPEDDDVTVLPDGSGFFVSEVGRSTEVVSSVDLVPPDTDACIADKFPKLISEGYGDDQALAIALEICEARDAGKPYVWLKGDTWYLADAAQSDYAVGSFAEIEPLWRDWLAGTWNPNTGPQRSRSTRRSAPVELCISFADNQFVKYARRTLSDWLTERGVHDVDWELPEDWRLTLAVAADRTPNDVASLLRKADYGDGRKLDLRATSYIVHIDAVYLGVEMNDALDALVQASQLDLDASEQYAVPGIRLCRLNLDSDLVDFSDVPAAAYPLVATNVTVRFGATTQHQWALRALSNAQQKELTSWRNVIRRKGRDYDFSVESLPPVVEAYIRMALESDEDASRIFDDARDMLRAYRDTRAGYVQAVTDILVRALSDEGTRRVLGSTMRSTARRFGLQAAFDALEDAAAPNTESLSEDDVTLFRAWLAETSTYITNLGEEIFKEGGLSEAMIATRAQMWADKSLDDVYYAILRQNAPAKRVLWRRTPGKDSCSTCISNDGQTFTLDELGQRGFPRDRRLECGGWECECEVVDVETGKVLRSR